MFGRVCAQGLREAVAYLERLEQALFEQRSAGWAVVGFRTRTLVTRFGEVSFRRRLYRDESGKYRFLLDEYLRLKAHQAATPEMQAICTSMSSEMSFRKAADMIAQCLAGVLSPSSCWRLLQRTGKAAASAEAAAVEAVFERGEVLAQAGEREVERLYIEADGVYVRLQRQPQRHLELRSAIAYEGWERLTTTREAYRLRGKRVYCHAGQPLPFWEGASLAWARRWDVSRIREVIIGGDGAGWIRAGTEEFPTAVWHLDNFHLARACGRAYGAQVGQGLYGALREGQAAEVEEWLQHAPTARRQASTTRLPMGQKGRARKVGAGLARTAGRCCARGAWAGLHGGQPGTLAGRAHEGKGTQLEPRRGTPYGESARAAGQPRNGGLVLSPDTYRETT